MKNPPTAPILASQSPRRAQLLREAGFDVEQRSPPFADPDQPPEHLRGHEAEHYATSLALDKAMSLRVQFSKPALILAADTICVDEAGLLVGKPVDAAHARAMLLGFVNRSHRVITGVALVQVVVDEESHNQPPPHCFADTAVVRFGAISDRQLDEYLVGDDWRGKAGGYNLFDRQAAGWPIDVEGDPTTVVGLPMRRLMPMLRAALNSSG